jgi:hypothetical protein
MKLVRPTSVAVSVTVDPTGKGKTHVSPVAAFIVQKLGAPPTDALTSPLPRPAAVIDTALREKVAPMSI